ncbi:hypothetical protein [Chryseobacterium balustinum]|uniref:Gliding motility-associated C-terminal domain-containing protein n=1 Tax=Chryseobacterium balustinum TaxID=246 RepID=A0AAX2ISJ8_9FLAO|nr:hypothetical protein [Chryseobacterium balustinum]SKC12074.1 hypothetical protein SAMN05421800_13810 [Chryseobacterium balustinum]SQA92753.1 Uncharacterised protein [Chryseobacterium balustinum]
MLKLSFLNVFFSIFLVPLMMQCEDGRQNPCENYTNYIYEENLCQLEPAKLTYNQGETVNFKFSVKSKLSANGKSLDIYKETQLKSGLLLINLAELFKDNTVVFIQGEKVEDNRFKAVYNTTTDSYDLEIQVKLNRSGIYSFDSTATFQDRAHDDGNCSYIAVTTNIKGNNLDDGRTEFVVN